MDQAVRTIAENLNQTPIVQIFRKGALDSLRIWAKSVARGQPAFQALLLG
jgi:hypothetical protein